MLDYVAGDTQAFERLYQRHRAALYRYFLRQTRQSAVAEELYQEVWLNLIRARQRYKVEAKFTTYLYHLAHNRLIDHYRRTGRGIPLSYSQEDRDEMETVPADARHEPLNRAVQDQQLDRLAGVIADLPEAQRESFLLKEESGLSLAEIAEATGVGEETAKSRLRYAFKRIRQVMNNDD